MSTSRNAGRKLGGLHFAAIVIFFVIFAVLSFVVYNWTNEGYPLWEIIAVIAALWLVYLLIVYFITHFGEASLYPRSLA